MLLQIEERKTFDVENKGQKIFGMFQLPEQKNCPLVLILHGFASSKIGTHRSWVRLGSLLVQNGIGCCRFDFRGSGDSEGEAEEMTISDFVSDAEVVMQYLNNQGYSNIGLFGSSFGGSIAVLVSSQTDVKALALWAPVASGMLWYKDWVSRQENLTSSHYHGVEIREHFKKDFADFHPDEVMPYLKKIPLLHMQADRDEVVSISHAEALKKARGDSPHTKFIRYRDREHQLGKSVHFPQACQEICLWFKEFLGPNGRNL